LPKRTPAEDYTTFTLYPQDHDTIQELKLAINEWVGGYWLGPYALALPRQPKGKAQSADGTGLSVPVGESLSEYLEVLDVFGEERDNRVLDVIRGEPLPHISWLSA
jgi:protein TIF31